MIESGDKKAKLVLDAMLYQISKQIGTLSINFGNNLDAIILTGAMSKSTYVTNSIKNYISFLAKVEIFAGELEMSALSNGVLRVLTNSEEVLEYTGVPVERNNLI